MDPTDISPPRRRIYLMRHGSVDYFSESGRHPDPDAVGLNEVGRDQASLVGLSFAHAGLHFDRVIVSGLARTIETARRVLAETRQKVTIETWPDLRELRAGPLEDIPDKELRTAFVGTFEGVVPPEKRFANGESIGELLARVHPAIARLRADPNWQTVLLVLHGGVNRAIVSLALTGQPIFIGNMSQAPACVNALDVGSAPNDWVVRFIGVAPYDLLQAHARATTLEAMLLQFLKTRRDAAPD